MWLFDETGGLRNILAWTLITIVFSFSVSFGLYFIRGPEPEPVLTCADWLEAPDRALADEVADELAVTGTRDGRELAVIDETVDGVCRRAALGRPLVDSDLRGAVSARLRTLR